MFPVPLRLVGQGAQRGAPGAEGRNGVHSGGVHDRLLDGQQRIDEELYELLDWLRWAYEKEEWAAKDSQYRRMIIEKYFEDRK